MDTPALSSSVYGRAALLGAVAGLRSLMPWVLLSVQAQRPATMVAGTDNEGGPSWGPLAARPVLVVLALASFGEVVGDKLPMVPSRLSPVPLGGRLISGALAGAAVSRAGRLSPLTGALLGATAAGGGSLAGYFGRTQLSRLPRVPSIVWAVAEDALALSLGRRALRHSSPP